MMFIEYSSTKRNVVYYKFNLIGGKGLDAWKIIVTDVLDRLVVSTRPGMLDTCPDQRLCNEIIRHLVLIQKEEKAAGEILAVSREAAEEYFAKEEQGLSWQSAGCRRWHKKREREGEDMGGIIGLAAIAAVLVSGTAGFACIAVCMAGSFRLD